MGSIEDRDLSEGLSDFHFVLGATWAALRTETLVKELTLPGSQSPKCFKKHYLFCFAIYEWVMLYDRKRNDEHCCMPVKMHDKHMATTLEVSQGM